MSKIKVDVLLKKNGEQLICETYCGIFQDFNIKYSDGIVNVYDICKCLLKRKMNDCEIVLNFRDNISKCIYNDFELSLNLKTHEFVESHNQVFVKYQLEESVFEYKINWRKV